MKRIAKEALFLGTYSGASALILTDGVVSRASIDHFQNFGDLLHQLAAAQAERITFILGNHTLLHAVPLVDSIPASVLFGSIIGGGYYGIQKFKEKKSAASGRRYEQKQGARTRNAS